MRAEYQSDRKQQARCFHYLTEIILGFRSNFPKIEAILMQNRRKSERKCWPLGALGDFET
jgi:hypothetical protein